MRLTACSLKWIVSNRICGEKRNTLYVINASSISLGLFEANKSDAAVVFLNLHSCSVIDAVLPKVFSSYLKNIRKSWPRSECFSIRFILSCYCRALFACSQTLKHRSVLKSYEDKGLFFCNWLNNNENIMLITNFLFLRSRVLASKQLNNPKYQWIVACECVCALQEYSSLQCYIYSVWWRNLFPPSKFYFCYSISLVSHLHRLYIVLS